MGYFDNDKKILNASQKEPLLPLFESSFNFPTSYFLPRSTLRQREKYILFLIILCFIIFLIGGVFFLPELKAGKQFAYKHISKAGSDFIGLPKPNNNGPKPFFDLNIPSSQNFDKQKFERKFNNDLDSNVLPKPNLNRNKDLKAVLDPEIMKLPSEFNLEEDRTPDYRRDTIKEMMLHAWNNYVKYAWGSNELKPISRQGHSAGIFGTSRLGASVIDGLDTLIIMGLKDEYAKAREFVEKELDFNSLKSEISVFEFNIRFVGGLLSAYALTKDPLYIKKADEIAEKLLPAFETKTGIPYGLINPETGEMKNYRWASSSSSILAEFGTIHLEFIYLSYLTGKSVYKEKVEKIRNFLDKIEKKDGLYYNYVNPIYGSWGQAHVSMGGLGDSFYEYLLKSWLQTNKKDEQAFRMYYESIDAILVKLKGVNKDGLMYLGQLKYDKLYSKMEHLACFSGGLIALGGNVLDDEEKRKHYISIGANLTNTCHESYTRSATKLGPETFELSESSPIIKSTEYHYLQRPEVIESYFYLWRITKNPKYRDWAWEAALAIQKYCRVENGFTGIKNVYSKNPAKDDVQQSYLLSETFKYLYLIFSDDSVIPLDKWVFNTEGHPLPIADHNSAYMLNKLSN